MDPHLLVYIFILIILIGISALCSMTETALSSVSIIRIKAKARKGDKKSIKVYRLVKKYSETVTTILIFNNIVNRVDWILVINKIVFEKIKCDLI